MEFHSSKSEILTARTLGIGVSASEFSSQSLRDAILHGWIIVILGEIYLQKAKKKLKLK